MQAYFGSGLSGCLSFYDGGSAEELIFGRLGRCLRRRMQGCRPAASRRGFGALEISDRLLADRFAAGREVGRLRRIRNLLLAEMGRIPSSLPEVSQILFSYRAAGNRTSCRRNPVGRGVIPNVIVIFVTMKQAVTPLRLGSDRISSLLVRYAIPSIIAMTSSSLYNLSLIHI